MFSESDLDEAAAAGAIPPDEVERLRRFQSERRRTPGIDEEEFRLVTGFNDIFVSLAAIIALFAVATLGSALAPPLGAAAVAAASFWLAFLFTAKRRMALPSIILLGAFVLGIGSTISLLGGEALAAIAAAVAALVHWRFFRVPITVAFGTGALVILWLSLASGSSWNDGTGFLTAMLFAGVAVFALAMWWDRSDPGRVTRRSDIAFWLHLQAATLIVHPLFWLTGLAQGSATPGGAAIVMIVYVALNLVALAIDRRALLVSALAYVLFALGSLMIKMGPSGLAVPLTALVIGSALLLLSALWHHARRGFVRRLPTQWRHWLPDLDRQPVQPTVSPAPAA